MVRFVIVLDGAGGVVISGGSWAGTVPRVNLRLHAQAAPTATSGLDGPISPF
jgi:hypothetical protein